MRGDLDLTAVEVVFSPHAFRVVGEHGAAAFFDSSNRRFFRRHLSDDFTRFGHLLLGDQRGFVVTVRIGEQPRRGTRVVENVEIIFVIVVAHPRAAADDLLEFHHRADHASDDDVLASGNIDTGCKQLRCGHEYRRHGLKFLELAEQALSEAALVRSDAAHVIGILPNQIGVQIIERAAHLVRVLLVDAEDDRLGKAIGFFIKSVRLRAIAWVRALSATARSKSTV